MAPPASKIERDNQLSEDIIKYILENNDEDKLIEIAKRNSQNVEFVTRICEHIHATLKTIHNTKTRLSDSLAAEQSVATQINHKKSTTAYYKLSQEEEDTLNNVSYHRGLYNDLPDRLRISFVEYQRKLTDASVLLLQAAFTSYEKELKIVRFNNAPPSNAANNNNTKPSTNGDSMEVDKATTAEGDAQEEALFKKFEEVLEKILSPIKLPEMIMEVAKILEDHKLGVLCIKVCQRAANAILEQREREKKTRIRSPIDLNHLPYQVVERATSSLFSTLAFFNTKITKKETLGQLELQDFEILQNGELLKEIIEFYIPTILDDPDLILKIGSYLLEKEQFKHVILLTERARIRLNQIEALGREMVNVEKKIADLRLDIESIRKVKGDTSAKEREIDALQVNVNNYSFLPSHARSTPDQCGQYNLKIAQLRVKCILEMKKAAKVNAINMTDVNEKLEETLNTLRDPQHIYELAKLLQTHKENEASLKYGERCQLYIGELEQLREQRLPIQNQIDAIVQEEKNIRLAGNELSKAQQEKLALLRTKLASLQDWPYYAQLNVRHQYDELHLLIAIVMISSVLDSKNSLEQMVGAAEYAAKKALIDRQFENLVQLCLEKFKDPSYLVKFSSHMRGSKEDKVVIKITHQLFKRCAEIEDMRHERLAAMKRIKQTVDDIPRASLEKQQQLLAKKKEQEQALENLPVWPHYAKLEVDRQYEDTKYQASLSLMESLLECYNFIEEKLRKKKMYGNQAIASNISEEDLIKERESLNQRISESLAVCLPNLDNPELFIKLATQLAPRRESIFIEISKYFHTKLQELAVKSSQLKQDQIMLSLLEEELAELTRMKKDMSEDDIAELERLRDHVTKTAATLPYLKEYLEASKYHSTMCVLGVKTVYDARAQIFSKYSEDAAQRENALRQSKENIAFVHKQIEDYVDNPNTLIEIMNTLMSKKELSTLSAVGKLAFSRLDKFRAFQSDKQATAEKKKVLNDEKEALDKQRRRLQPEKHRQLRQLIAKQRVDEAHPEYEHADSDKFALQIANILISSVAKEKADFEASISSMSEDSLHRVPAQRRKLVADIEEMSKLCVSFISTLETLMTFAQDLFNKKEYALVIQVGRVVEGIIDEKRLLIERKEELTKELRLHQQQYLQQKDDGLRAKIQIQIDRTQAAIDAVRPPYTYDQICKHTLTITKLIIDAANFEDLGEVIRNATIVAFKVDPTAERWDSIRYLSSEEEWAQIKEQLVVFVMKREENLNSKIELLMKDGLFKQCIEIFPHPSTEEAELNVQMVLLESLYEAVDQHALHLLPTVLPLVHKYAKRCYQEWKSDRLESLYDVVQKRYPEEIAKMFEAAIDMILVNILQSQYPSLLAMLKSFKKRMTVTLGLDTLWQKFLESFKQKNKTKKRLIQMINLIGDSVWQIEQNPSNPHPVQKKKKAATGAATEPIKKIKVNLATPTFASPNNNNNLLQMNPSLSPNDDDQMDEDLPSTPVQSDDE